MITIKTEKPIPGNDTVWESEVRFKELTPARRDKLIALLNLAGFVVRQSDSPILKEITDNGGVLKIGV